MAAKRRNLDEEIRQAKEKLLEAQLENYNITAGMPIPGNFEDYKQELAEAWELDNEFDDPWLLDKLSENLIKIFWNLFQKRPWETDEWYFLPSSYIFNIDFATDENTLRESDYFYFEGPMDINFITYNDKGTNAYCQWSVLNRVLAYTKISDDLGIPLFDLSDMTIDERIQNFDEYLQYHDQKNQSDINPNSIDSELKNDKQKSRYIPREVQDRVWRRDEGKCVDCGSNENLEFDHIIPHSKGGANTYRNIQLLCEKCNRSKSDNIG